jgi:hypothetical protein
MGEELATGLALCTAWAGGDMEAWGRIVSECGVTDVRSRAVLGQVSQVAAMLAKAIATEVGLGWDEARVFQHLALDALGGDGGPGS